MDNDSNPILHVCVIGFHHKKGCQLEYAFPPLIPGDNVDSQNIPSPWKHLPSLALPDGAHNFDKDTIYFHLQSLDEGQHTVYGISCYRQIEAEKLIRRTSDVTRSTVQKSVCVLSKLPLYGLIQAKLELITYAYFEEGDFSKVSLLEDMYHNLSSSVSNSFSNGHSMFLGMSARDLVIKYKHKILMLFKLILLERKVLFFQTPVSNLSNTMLAVLSLYPGMIEYGLKEAAGSPTKRISNSMSDMKFGSSEFVDVHYEETKAKSADISDVDPKSEEIGGLDQKDDKISDTPKRVNPTIPPFGTENEEALCPTGSGWQAAKEGRKIVTPNTPPITSQPLPGVHTPTQSAKADPFANKLKEHNISRTSIEYERDEGNSTFYVKNFVHNSSQNVANDASKSPVDSGASPRLADRRNVNIDPLHTDTNLTHADRIQKDVEVSMCVTEDPLEHLDNITTLTHVQSYDLDSPESLSQIDKEDCFSWEEDKLLLEIEAELSDKESEVEVKQGKIDENLNCDNAVKNDVCDKRNSKNGEIIKDTCSTNVVTTPEHSATQPTVTTPTLESASSLHSPLLSTSDYLKKFLPGSETEEVELRPVVSAPPQSPTTLPQDDCGFPLAIFTKGAVCHPYLPLQYYDLLEDVNIRSFVIGATNVLFQQKKHLTDVIIGENEMKIEIHDVELRKALNLTTADLRFADFIVRSVIEEVQDDVYLDGTGWEGGEEWLRVQFRMYLLSLLASVESTDEKLLEDYNPNFINAWKTTHNYRVWRYSIHTGIDSVHSGHPFKGQISMADMKLRINHSMDSTEKGRKVSAAVQTTGKVVLQTGKAVGSAITNAKSAVSSWLGSWKTEKGDKS